jgi:Plant transposon protein
MVVFSYPRAPNAALLGSSLLRRLMANTTADATDTIRFVNDDKNDWFVDERDKDVDDDDDSIIMHVDFDNIGRVNGLPVEDEERTPQASPVRKKTRVVYARKHQEDSLWWKEYLTPTIRQVYAEKPDGRDAAKFRRLFRVPFELFVVLVGMAREKWWCDWSPTKVDAFGFVVSNLELKLLGALYVLGNGTSLYIVSIQTNLSEEVHRCFFLFWIANMSSMKDDFIFMPNDEERFLQVVGEYSARGLPGCVGSVDCVHVAWDKCPSQYMHMYKGKEGFPSIAYEVICTARKFIQSVSVGHPGSRNDKHIVRTDSSVMDLLEGNGWLNSKAWQTVGPTGALRNFIGVYLICDGGYHRWPCLISPVKSGIAGSPVMKWSAKVESVRKDIEGVFGILKSRFRFLKNFINLHQQSAIDNAFVTCCMLHNMLLKVDGYLDSNLAPFPGGVEERLAKKFANTWNGNDGLWNRFDDDTIDEEMDRENQRQNPVTKNTLSANWSKVTAALVDHHQFADCTL